jgi:hypothetical protein
MSATNVSRQTSIFTRLSFPAPEEFVGPKNAPMVVITNCKQLYTNVSHRFFLMIDGFPRKREPLSSVFGRDGCGKSARPVRRGDSRSRPNRRSLFYSTGMMVCDEKNQTGFKP